MPLHSTSHMCLPALFCISTLLHCCYSAPLVYAFTIARFDKSHVTAATLCWDMPLAYCYLISTQIICRGKGTKGSRQGQEPSCGSWQMYWWGASRGWKQWSAESHSWRMSQFALARTCRTLQCLKFLVLLCNLCIVAEHKTWSSLWSDLPSFVMLCADNIINCKNDL